MIVYAFLGDYPWHVSRKKWIDSFSVTKHRTFPDCTMEFITTLSLEGVRQILASIPDCHVMLESVHRFTDYTDERNGEISTTFRALTDAAKTDSDEEFPKGEGHCF